MSLIVCLAAIETANTAINKFSYYSECSFAWACVCVLLMMREPQATIYFVLVLFLFGH